MERGLRPVQRNKKGNSMTEGFEIKKSTRTIPAEYEDVQQVEVTKSNNDPAKQPSTSQILAKGVVDNLPQMIELGKEIASIRKIKVMTDGEVKILEKKKQMLLADAEAYAIRKGADTKDAVTKMENTRKTLEMIFRNTDDRLSGEDLANVIKSVMENSPK